jgi:hypothetical protein
MVSQYEIIYDEDLKMKKMNDIRQEPKQCV